jgi:hypothetical protein
VGHAAGRQRQAEEDRAELELSIMSRVAFPSPIPAEFEGRRYEQVRNGRMYDLEQRTGLIAIVDIASGRRVAFARIYDYPRDEWDEDDVGDVFMTSIKVDEAAREIVVTTERDDRFAYRVDDGSVRQLG